MHGCKLNDGFSSPVLPHHHLVLISASRSGSLSAGTPLTLTCTTILSQFVDDGEEVNDSVDRTSNDRTEQWTPNKHHQCSGLHTTICQ